ncbi:MULTISPECIES: alpha/beta hydrolase [Brachybacterium]|uniref:Esterase n=2 Tax=Brachybacterium TaxID=43668 RepID=A0A3R8RQN2_9MICO|nr:MULTISPECIES: esterase [Brachybacterium]RRR19297.1 esterase [Brachybacterium paraconglomeratum]GLI29686.1 esterase [Brachybacterium conglomeratum]GLK05446.1 esterase [Brachybacterium conglomeratum]
MTTSPQYGPVELISPHLDPSAVVRGGAQDAPIVLLMHGLGSDERDLASLVPFLPPVFEYVSVRGIFRYVQGFAWFDMPVAPDRPEAIEASSAAVEEWIAAQDRPVVGAIGFSQGGAVALQLLRRDPHALRFVVNLSGFPFPAAMQGDTALAEVRPPALWGHGGMDPLYDPEREQAVREFMSAHTALEEERRPQLGHAVDEIELRAVAAFLQRRAADADGR